MINDPGQIEFLLSQMGDASLTAEQRAAVQAALAADPALRAIASRYERLDALLAQVRSEGVTADSAELAARVREAVRESLEYQMSRGLDADLADDEASRLRRTVEAAPELQRTQEAFARTDDLLRGYAANQPAVDFDALAARIGSQVAREAVRSRATGRGWRIAAIAAPLAAAACIVLVLLLGRGTSETESVAIKETHDAGPTHRMNGPGRVFSVADVTPLVRVKIDAPAQASRGRVDVRVDQTMPRGFVDPLKAQQDAPGLVSGRASLSNSKVLARSSLTALY